MASPPAGWIPYDHEAKTTNPLPAVGHSDPWARGGGEGRWSEVVWVHDAFYDGVTLGCWTQNGPDPTTGWWMNVIGRNGDDIGVTHWMPLARPTVPAAFQFETGEVVLIVSLPAVAAVDLAPRRLLDDLARYGSSPARVVGKDGERWVVELVAVGGQVVLAGDHLRHDVPAPTGPDDLWERIDRLRADVAGDDLMGGVPRYRRRFTETTSTAVHLLGRGIDRLQAELAALRAGGG